MSGNRDSTTAAVASLEEDYDKRDRSDGGWSPRVLPRGGGRDFFSIKEDGYPSCESDSPHCHSHVGEVDYTDLIVYEGYGFGTYRDHYGGKLPCYGIPLIEDHWRSPCP